MVTKEELYDFLLKMESDDDCDIISDYDIDVSDCDDEEAIKAKALSVLTEQDISLYMREMVDCSICECHDKCYKNIDDFKKMNEDDFLSAISALMKNCRYLYLDKAEEKN